MSARDQIWLDPGLGFGKTARTTWKSCAACPNSKRSACPSSSARPARSFLGKILGTDDPNDRKEGTAATVALSIAGGADMVRVHDVREMARVAKVSDAIVRGWEEQG